METRKIVVLIVLTVLVASGICLSLLIYRGSFTGNAVLTLPEQEVGAPLTGFFTIDSTISGPIPLASDVTVDLNGDVSTMSLVQLIPLTQIPPTQTINFGPTVDVVLSFVDSGSTDISTTTGSSSGASSTIGATDTVITPTGDTLVVHVRRSKTTVSVSLPAGKKAVVVDASVRGEPIDKTKISLISSATKVRVSTTYYEQLAGFTIADSAGLAIDLSAFNKVAPPHGTLSVKLAYKGDVIDQATQTFEGVLGDNDPLLQEEVTSTVPVLTPELVVRGCNENEYHCEPFSECSIPGINEIASTATTVPVEKAFCTYDGCGKRFVIARECSTVTTEQVAELTNTGQIDLPDTSVPVEDTPQVVDFPIEETSPIIAKYRSEKEDEEEPSEGEGVRGVTIVDSVLDVPVAHVILDQREEKSSLDVVFVQSQEEVQPQCYNSIQDEDEEGIDCGGSECKACVSEKPRYFLGVLWLSLVVLGGMLALVIRSQKFFE